MTILRKYGAALITAALALVAALVGIGALTVWRPGDQIVASGSTSQPYIMSRAGVLGLYADQVTVTASAPGRGQRVALALGSAGDVQGWLRTSPYTEITGLADLRGRALKVVTHGAVSGEGQGQSGVSATGSPSASAASPSPSAQGSSGADMGPLASDMWVREVAGSGSVSMTVQGAQTEDVLIAATDGRGAAPTITLSWPEARPNVLAWIAFGLAVLLALGAAAFALFERRQAARAAERGPATRHMRARADATPTQMLRLPSAHPEDHAAPAAGAHPEDHPAPPAGAHPEGAEQPEGGTDGASFAPVHERAGQPEDRAQAAGTAQKEKGQGATPASPPASPRAEGSTEPKTAATASGAPEQKPAGEAAPRRGSHAGAAASKSQELQAPSGRPTSQVIDVSSVSPGVVFPSRRALREARERGQDKIVLDGHEFNTGLIPVVQHQEQHHQQGTRERREGDEGRRRGEDA